MDIIEMTRELGKALQNDDRFVAYTLAKQANDEDAELQELLKKFDELRAALSKEFGKGDEGDQETIQKTDAELKACYKSIMSNKNMAVFQSAQSALETLVNNMTQIITMCANGSDPETCEPSKGCTGSCSTCGGCG